jgi:hypothetical protein
MFIETGGVQDQRSSGAQCFRQAYASPFRSAGARRNRVEPPRFYRHYVPTGRGNRNWKKSWVAARFADDSFKVGTIKLPGSDVFCLFNWNNAPQRISFHLPRPVWLQTFGAESVWGGMQANSLSIKCCRIRQDCWFVVTNRSYSTYCAETSLLSGS